MKNFFITILIIFNFCSYGQKKKAKSLNTVKTTIIDFYAQSKNEILKYNKLIKQNPKDGNAYYNRGFEKYTFDLDYKGAILDFTEAIKNGYENDAETYYLRGDAKCKLKDYRGAISDYDTAIEIDINRINNLESENGYEARANAKLGLKDFEGAKNDFTESLKINAESNNCYFLRAYCELSLENKENACLDLSKAGELGHPRAYEMIEKYCN
jgi:tetratricopeptide (TPR) repeat protein